MPAKSGNVQELTGLSVTVDRVVYQPDAETPPDHPHCFVYYITIHNRSDRPITVKGRKWVVVDESGEITAVEGAGVIGQCPLIPVGGSFSYHSYHLLSRHSAAAEGSYLGVDEQGQAVFVRIPRFKMQVPGWSKPG